MPDIRVFANSHAAAAACAQQIFDWIEDAISQRGTAFLAVSGGSSPKPMFEVFRDTDFNWSRVHLFWADERCVPPDDPQSNFKLANDAWLRYLTPIRAPVVHRVRTELAPAEAAADYEREIRTVVSVYREVKGNRLPVFDVIHRGMGPDAHTASLFPGEPLIEDREHVAGAVWAAKFQQWRVTLLPGVLEAARHTAVLAAGNDKAEALRSVLEGPVNPLQWPAQLAPGAVWFVDAAATAAISAQTRS